MKTNNKILWVIISLLVLWSCKDDVENTKPLTGIAVTPQSVNLVIGSSQQITATSVPEDADPNEMPFKWESSNTKTASVSSSGLIQALSVGKTNIIVYGRVSNNIHTTIPVTVTQVSVPLTAIHVTTESLTLTTGELKQLTARPEPENATSVSFIWNSDHPDIATVSINGQVYGKSAGLALITVKSGDIEKTILVTVKQPPLRIPIGSTSYAVDTLNYEEVSQGVKWFKFSMPEFVNGFGTLGKGLVVNLLEVDLTYPGNRIEVVPASTATWGNIERPSAMSARKQKEFSGTSNYPAAVINGDFYLLSSGNSTGYAYINNRPIGIEITNGMVVQTPYSSNSGFIIHDDGTPDFSNNISFSGKVESGGKSFTLAEVNGYAGAGELVLFNNQSNSYPTDSAFAWSPYTSTMVSLSYPEKGWRVNDRMEFTVTAVDYNIETTIPAAEPYKGKDFNGQGAILVGNSFGNPEQTLRFADKPEKPNSLTVSDKGNYWELTTTGSDPNSYTTGLTSSVTGAPDASFSFDYQSATSINDFQIFYGRPSAAVGVSTGENLQLVNTGIDPENESKWKTFTHELKTAITNHQWGKTGHTFRLDIGNGTGHHVLIRNMKIKGKTSGEDSKTFLNNLSVGDKVDVAMDIKMNGTKQADKHLHIIGSQDLLLKNGTPVNTWNEVHPRTAIGYSQDKKKIYLIVIDGRQTNYSVGATTGQVGAIIKAFGAYNAANLDGGGSSCMVVNGEIKNKPSDKSERAVANGVMVVVKK
ncbi:MAG TPA: hypothetical protein DDW85_01915 [Porphyromonadaceae bacterium]|nr:hypothetical protein [Porphyromonadaceae bacterium]